MPEHRLGPHALVTGVPEPAQVEGLIKALVERFGRLDILVNNAAIFVPGTVGGEPVSDIAALDRQLAINVGGAAAAVRAAARVMGAGSRSRITGSFSRSIGQSTPPLSKLPHWLLAT